MTGGQSVMELTAHKLLTLDFWQDSVTYEGRTMPSGSLACAALNIPDDTVERLGQLCAPLNLYMGLLQLEQVQSEPLRAAKESALQIVELLRDTPPFSILDAPFVRSEVDKVFSEDYLQNAIAYSKTGDLASALMPEYKKAVSLLRVLPVMAHLGYSLAEFKREMLAFAEKLHGSDRTPDGYAAEFGKFFSDTPQFSDESASWMAMSNTTVQYASAKIPGGERPQLVKRMHYVSFVGMFRSDLFEGLCVGHAPRKCLVCGRWFLTTDARLTKYCGGLAPGDSRGRTCRQIGNLRGRAQRELAADHPLKKIYERRTNTIIQKLRRRTLDKPTADVMKRLAKDKLERAISDHSYAIGPYESEMEQDALLTEAQRHLHQQEKKQ